MEPHYWILAAVGLLAIVVIVGMLISLQRLEWDDVPEPFRDTFESIFPEFEILWIKHRASTQKYLLGGQYRGRDAEVVIKYEGEDALREFEFMDFSLRTLKGAERCETSELTPEVINHAGGLMGDERNDFKMASVMKGRYREEDAFKVAGQTPNWEWDFVVTAAGMLIGMEMEKR